MNKALEYAKQIAYSTEETLMFTYEMAKKYYEKPGCYVECGVAAGAQIIAMASGAPGKRIFAFDSFEGIPLPSNKDDQYPGIRFLSKEEQKELPNPGEQKLESTGATSVSMDDFWDHLDRSGVITSSISSVKGWFENTIHTWNAQPISILRLDGDLYNSTKVCLSGLYPYVISGGIIIIDDWQLPGCQQAVKDFCKQRKIGSSKHKTMTYEPEIKFVSNIAYWVKP